MNIDFVRVIQEKNGKDTPSPCRRIKRFSSVPSSLGVYTNGTLIPFGPFLGGFFTRGRDCESVVEETSRRVISLDMVPNQEVYSTVHITAANSHHHDERPQSKVEQNGRNKLN